MLKKHPERDENPAPRCLRTVRIGVRILWQICLGGWGVCVPRWWSLSGGCGVGWWWFRCPDGAPAALPGIGRGLGLRVIRSDRVAFLPVFQLFPVCGVPVGGWCGVAALRRSDGLPFLSRIIIYNKVRRTTERVGKGAKFGQKRGLFLFIS